MIAPDSHLAASPPKPKRFVVKPFDTSLTSEQWKSWGETKLEDVAEPVLLKGMASAVP